MDSKRCKAARVFGCLRQVCWIGKRTDLIFRSHCQFVSVSCCFLLHLLPSSCKSDFTANPVGASRVSVLIFTSSKLPDVLNNIRISSSCLSMARARALLLAVAHPVFRNQSSLLPNISLISRTCVFLPEASISSYDTGVSTCASRCQASWLAGQGRAGQGWAGLGWVWPGLGWVRLEVAWAGLGWIGFGLGWPGIGWLARSVSGAVSRKPPWLVYSRPCRFGGLLARLSGYPRTRLLAGPLARWANSSKWKHHGVAPTLEVACSSDSIVPMVFISI